MNATAGPAIDAASALDIGVQCLVGLVEVTLDGSLDETTVIVGTGALERLLVDGATTIDLDCTELVGIDGFGLALLVAVDRQLRARGGSLVVRYPQPRVQDLLRSAGLAHDLLVA